jgi:hypothetical protein
MTGKYTTNRKNASPATGIRTCFSGHNHATAGGMGALFFFLVMI